jgi:two-component system, sensor histidine kinase
VAEIRSLEGALRTAAHAMRERQQLIEREKEALQAADRAKDEFLATLSHELRNPLAGLTTAAHLLKVAGDQRDVASQAQGVIERQTAQVGRLIEDLLDLSRVAMGKASLERETLDLASAARTTVEQWRASGRLDRHAVSLDASAAWIDADRARVEQILVNLLDNALKFTPPGRPVNISVRREGSDAVLEVSDSGDGLEKDLIERVFEPFVQGDRGFDRRHGGLGLGLALAKRLAEMHGGTIAAASEGPGRGARFTVHLPAAAAPQGRRASAEAPQHAGTRRILIVEDNDDTRRMLRAMLVLKGHDVREASDGTTALAAVAEARPDVALIDIGLPDIDGYELARRLRETGQSRIALIALTGYGQAGDQSRAFQAGFDAHLIKPVAAEVLERVIGGLR